MRLQPKLQTSPRKPSGFDLRRLVGSVNQLRFNDNRGEVAFFGQKMIILRRDVIRVMREALERIVGDQAAPFLSFLASGVGIHEGSIFRDSITSTGQEQRAGLENLVRSAFEDTNLGLGKIQIRKIDFDNTQAVVDVANCFEAMENGPAEGPNCMFTSGFLAGLFAEVFDKTIQAKETCCISQGSGFCEFELSLADGVESSEEAAQPQPMIDPKMDSNKDLKMEPPSTVPVKTEPPVKTDTPPMQPPQPQKESSKPTAPMGANKGEENVSEIKQSDVDAGVARASRIAQRKQGFWEKHFKKK